MGCHKHPENNMGCLWHTFFFQFFQLKVLKFEKIVRIEQIVKIEILV